MSCQSAFILAKLVGNKIKTAFGGGGFSCPYINPSLLLRKGTMSQKLPDLLSTINGTELPSDFSHFWQIWGRTSSWFIKTFQLTAFSSQEKKKEKEKATQKTPEEFGTRQLFFMIYFYFFISYQMHSLEYVWGLDQQLVALVHELCNQWFILLWGGRESYWLPLSFPSPLYFTANWSSS